MISKAERDRIIELGGKAGPPWKTPDERYIDGAKIFPAWENGRVRRFIEICTMQKTDNPSWVDQKDFIVAACNAAVPLAQEHATMEALLRRVVKHFHDSWSQFDVDENEIGEIVAEIEEVLK